MRHEVYELDGKLAPHNMNGLQAAILVQVAILDNLAANGGGVQLTSEVRHP